MNFSTSYQLLVLALVSTIASSYTDGWAGDGNEVIDQTFCGAGVVGNGVCEIVVDENGVALEPCCSIAGFCGYGLAYCGETGEGGGEGYCEIDPAIAGACLTEGECCSEFGFCSTQFCGEGSGGAGGGECLLDEDCLIQADCVAGDCCCSEYGYCGTSAEYCGGGEITGGSARPLHPPLLLLLPQLRLPQ
jgi:chitinase